MLDGLIRLSLRHRPLVLLISALLLVLGGQGLRQMPVDVFPDLNRPTVTVMVESGGLSPEEVELQVARPIELALGGAPGVERVRSQSAPGLAIIWAEFAWSTDLQVDRQQVVERLSSLEGALPEGVRPALGPQSSIMGEILLVGLSSADGGVEGPRLRDLAEQVLRPRLTAVPGVSQVIALGGGVDQLQVEPDPARLAQLKVSLRQVAEAVREAQGSTAGGFVDHGEQEWVVRSLARTTDPERIGWSPVPVEGGVVPLSQVARVRRAPGPQRGAAGVNGQAGVILSIQKQPGADTLALTRQIDEVLAEIAPGLPPGVEHHTLFRQADFISAAVDNVEEALRDGVILVLIILVLFLRSARTTAITLTAIPLSLLVGVGVLQLMGLTVNTMTLGGLAVAIGELVDDAIVDVENVWRRLRENAAQPSPRPTIEVVGEASREIRGSVVYSTVLVVLVMVPLFALEGLEGRLFAPLGVAYIASIIASLFISLSITPVLCSFLLPGALAGARQEGDGALVRWLKAVDRRLLGWALVRPGQLLALSLGMALGAAASLPWLGRSFLPPFQEGTATVNLQTQPGISLEASARLGQLAERLLLGVPEVQSTGRRTGRAEQDEHAEGVHYTEIDVDFAEEGRPREEVLADLRARLALLPGLNVNIGQPISHRLDHLLSGVRAEIAIKLYGPELDLLRAQAARVAAALAPIPGLVDLSVERQVLIPQLQVEIDHREAARHGLGAGALAEELELALAGVVLAHVPEGVVERELVLRLPQEVRADPRVLVALPIATPGGEMIQLGQVARLVETTGPNQILHEDGQRRIAISANTAGRDPATVVADIRAALDGLGPLPPGTSAHVGGTFESQERATHTIALLSLLSLAGMVGVLYSHLRSLQLTAQVLVNIPLALIGAVAALWLTGQPLSVASLVGFITLCGIATRNSILMISHYAHLVAFEGEVMGPAMVVRGSLERLVPVTMTALCAGIGLVPLALATGEPGKELLAPMAAVILGGLCSSTLLDMVLTPAVFLRWGGPALAPLVQSLRSPS